MPVKSNVCAAGFQLTVRLQLSFEATVGIVVPPVQPQMRTRTSPVDAGVSKGSSRPRFAHTRTVKTVPAGTLTATAACASLYLRSAPVSPTRFKPVKNDPAGAVSVAGLFAPSAGSMLGFTVGDRLAT